MTGAGQASLADSLARQMPDNDAKLSLICHDVMEQVPAGVRLSSQLQIYGTHIFSQSLQFIHVQNAVKITQISTTRRTMQFKQTLYQNELRSIAKITRKP